MRTIERSNTFKRDYKRKSKGRHRTTPDSDLTPVLMALAKDAPLESRQRDHNLTGNWQGCRECHIKPDLLLIYDKPDKTTLYLVRLGSHSELFG